MLHPKSLLTAFALALALVGMTAPPVAQPMTGETVLNKRLQLESQLRKLAKERRTLGDRLGEISLMSDEERTDEIQAEARKATEQLVGIGPKMDEVEAALDAMPQDVAKGDPATDEFATLKAQASRHALGAIAAMMADGKSSHSDGPLAEFQEHHKLAANVYPVEFLSAPARDAKSIEAAAGLTSAPTNVGTGEAPIETPVFADGDAAFMGVVQPIVPGGDQVYPTITTRPDVGGPHSDDTDVAETQLTIGSELLAPTRLQASVTGLRTQELRLPAFEPAIRETLRGALSEAFDDQCIAELLTVAQVAAGAVETFATGIKRLVFDNVEGRYARQESDLRVLLGASTMQFLASLYRTNNSDDSLLDAIRNRASGVRVSAHTPAVANNKQDALIALGVGRRAAVCPIWQGVEITVDRVTGAGKGQVEIFGAMFAAFSIADASAFRRVETQHA